MEFEIAKLLAFLGAGLSMGLGAVGSGLGLGIAATGAIQGSARQPYFSSTMFRNMLVGQAVTETTAIFSLVIAFLLYFDAVGNPDAPYSWAQGFAYLSAGLAMGIGSFGSGVGSGMVAADALKATARVPTSQGRVIMFMLIGQAWAQTGGIFALVIALLMTASKGLDSLSLGGTVAASGKFLGSAISVGLGAIGPAIGIAYVAAKACLGMAEAPRHSSQISNTFFVGSATTQSTTIYALIVALLLMYQTTV